MFEILFDFAEIHIKIKIAHLYRKTEPKNCEQLKKDFPGGIYGSCNKVICANYILYNAEI